MMSTPSPSYIVNHLSHSFYATSSTPKSPLRSQSNFVRLELTSESSFRSHFDVCVHACSILPQKIHFYGRISSTVFLGRPSHPDLT